jgi:hypothetical protein
MRAAGLRLMKLQPNKLSLLEPRDACEIFVKRNDITTVNPFVCFASCARKALIVTLHAIVLGKPITVDDENRTYPVFIITSVPKCPIYPYGQLP